MSDAGIEWQGEGRQAGEGGSVCDTKEAVSRVGIHQEEEIPESKEDISKFKKAEGGCGLRQVSLRNILT